MIKHVVLFSYNDDVSDDSKNHIASRFLNLKNRMELVKHIECGLNNSPENLTHGYYHIFVLHFDNQKDRDSYLVHSEHKEFSKFAKSSLKNVLVFDYKV